MRYKKFILYDYKDINPSKEYSEEPILVANKQDISEVEACENLSLCQKIECMYNVICELFEIHDMEMQIAFDGISFYVITKDEGDKTTGMNSLWLCRKKLKEATTMELSGAMIDLILHRKTWSDEKTYYRLHLD